MRPRSGRQPDGRGLFDLFDLSGILACTVILAGLAGLYAGVRRAVTFGTRLGDPDARVVMLVATGVLIVGGILHLQRRRSALGLIVMAPGVFSTSLAYLFPDSGFAWVAFTLFGSLAVGAALLGCLSTPMPVKRGPP